MAKARFCRCLPPENKGFMSGMMFNIEEVPVKYVLYRKEGYYDVRKFIERVWSPSPTLCPDYKEGLHMCKRIYWCHIGLVSAPIWFIWHEFPGWVKKTPTPIIYRPDQLVGEFPPTIVNVDEFNKRWGNLADLKKKLDTELTPVAP